LQQTKRFLKLFHCGSPKPLSASGSLDGFFAHLRLFGQIPNRYLSGVALEIRIRRESRSFIGTIAVGFIAEQGAVVFTVVGRAIPCLTRVGQSPEDLRAFFRPSVRPDAGIPFRSLTGVG
jgi:hypothetical protein